jgi:hypothetical protein
VYADRRGFADDEDPFEIAAGFNMRQRWMRLMSRLLPIWAAAWMDAKSKLDEAYRAVLAVPDAERRERLTFELSDIPIDYAEVALPPGQPPRAGPADPRLWAARERAAFGERFRSHYARVLARAEASR